MKALMATTIASQWSRWASARPPPISMPFTIPTPTNCAMLGLTVFIAHLLLPCSGGAALALGIGVRLVAFVPDQAHLAQQLGHLHAGQGFKQRRNLGRHLG